MGVCAHIHRVTVRFHCVLLGQESKVPVVWSSGATSRIISSPDVGGLSILSIDRIE